MCFHRRNDHDAWRRKRHVLSSFDPYWTGRILPVCIYVERERISLPGLLFVPSIELINMMTYIPVCRMGKLPADKSYQAIKKHLQGRV